MSLKSSLNLDNEKSICCEIGWKYVSLDKKNYAIFSWIPDDNFLLIKLGLISVASRPRGFFSMFFKFFIECIQGVFEKSLFLCSDEFIDADKRYNAIKNNGISERLKTI